MTGTGHDKTAGDQTVPRLFCDLIGFPGQKRLIDLNLPCHDHGICRNLSAAVKDHDIVPHKLLRGNAPALSVPHRCHLRRIHHSHLFQNIPCPDLLKDSDPCIDKDHRKKRQVPKGSHNDQQHRQNQKDQIKVCKHIFPYDLSHGFRGRIHRLVAEAVLYPYHDLVPGKPRPPVRPLYRYFHPFLMHFLHKQKTSVSFYYTMVFCILL